VRPLGVETFECVVEGETVDQAGGGGAACVNLTVKNYVSWCNVRVGAGAASTASTQTVCVTPGAVTVAAAPLTGFILGNAPWHDTDGDTGGTGEAGTRTGNEAIATVTVGSTAKCAWVCCPFTNGTGCPTADQCP